MAYEKQNFEEGQVQKAEHLNYIEDGIEAVETSLGTTKQELQTLASKVTTIIYSETEPTGEEGMVWLKPVEES